MTLITFFRVLRFAWQGFWRNFWLSLTTISILVMIFLIINFLLVLGMIKQTALQSLRDRVDVSLYFHNDVMEEKVLETKEFLASHPQIKSIEYTSAPQALEQFRTLHREDSIILESLEELEQNPLGAILTVKTEDVSDYSNLVSILDNSKYASLISDKSFENNERFIQVINEVLSKINRVGIMITSFFVFIAVIIVFNTIRIAIYTHRDEIAIMRLVGAKNNFITAPFVVESVLYAIIACFLSLLLTYLLLDFIQPYVVDFFQKADTDLTVYFNNNFIVIFGLELFGVSLLSVLSCGIALRRYLRI